MADEWAFVRSYLEIESLRLEERLRLHLEAELPRPTGRTPDYGDALRPPGERMPRPANQPL